MPTRTALIRRLAPKLRIAWSVGCGILCALLIGLWVRSYSSIDKMFIPVTEREDIAFMSVDGTISVSKFWQTVPGYFDLHSRFKNETLTPQIINDPRFMNRIRFGISTQPIVITLPYWFVVPILAALGTFPWIHWRFSLRTLLIGITVLAAALSLLIRMSK
jgi:hypothetical protein